VSDSENEAVRDVIERVVVLSTPRQRVWKALTDPREVSAWFGTETEIDLRPGGRAVFGWAEEGRFEVVVDAVDPPSLFAYRWALDRDRPVDEGPSTRVEFSLEEIPEGTRLRLVESGFAALPDGVRDRHLADNTEGWELELAELAVHLGPQSGA
jgi:uncharacterized protein YndB with AHSA1/START domain